VAKAAHNAALKNEWQNKWRNSMQGKVLTEIDKSTPLSKFLKSISNPKLSRMEASRIAQIRLTHFPLNGYLKRVQKVNNTRCPACRADEETTEHFLLKCPSYTYKR